MGGKRKWMLVSSLASWRRAHCYPLHNALWPLGLLVSFLDQRRNPIKLSSIADGGLDERDERTLIRKVAHRKGQAEFLREMGRHPVNVATPFCANVEGDRSTDSSRKNLKRMVKKGNRTGVDRAPTLRVMGERASVER